MVFIHVSFVMGFVCCGISKRTLDAIRKEILLRNQIRDMIGGKIGKFTFGRNEYTFRFEPKEYRPVYEILVHWGGCGPKRFLMFCWPCISV